MNHRTVRARARRATSEHPLFRDDPEQQTLSCDTSANPLVPLRKNYTSGFYEPFNSNESGDFSEIINDDIDSVLNGRLCDCAPVPEMYCPDGVFLCNVVSQDPNNMTNVDVFCSETYEDAATNLFPIAIALFTVLCVLCCYSKRGHYSFIYLRKSVFRWEDERYEQVLVEEVNRLLWQARQARRSAELIRRQHAQQGQFVPEIEIPVVPQATHNPSSVVLKTRLLKEEESSKGEDEHCAICLQELVVGERVGDLRCGHIFHVDCIKTWIQRKNHCPLCKADGVANEVPEESAPQSI